MNKIFDNKIVMITGASSGFGAAFAEAFAREGASLILAARRKDRLDEIQKKLYNKYGVKIITVELDVADESAVVEKLSQLPSEFYTPDILINNAGMVKGLNKLWETAAKDWNQMIDTNVKGILAVSAQIIPRMLLKNAGHIINVGSVSSYETYAGGSVYCATKFAVKAITDTLRKELVATPLRVSMISPGLAKTEFSTVRFSGDQAKADSVYENMEPLTAEDMAEIVLFMASRPPHVNIADILVFPTNQASVSLVHRAS